MPLQVVCVRRSSNQFRSPQTRVSDGCSSAISRTVLVVESMTGLLELNIRRGETPRQRLWSLQRRKPLISCALGIRRGLSSAIRACAYNYNLHNPSCQRPAMSHVTLRNSYQTLSDRLNLFPQGAPPSELLFRILEVLFTRDEAALVALLPIKPFNVAAAAKVWKKPAAESRKILEGLASKGMLLDMEMQGEQIFVLPPPMAGFFEFSMMRMGNGYDQKLLAELFYQYLNVEEDFVKNLFAGGETQLGRVFVNERALAGDNTLDGDGLRKSQRSDPHGLAHGSGRLLLPSQDAAPGQVLRRAHGHLHDLQRHGPVAHQARHRAQGRCQGRHGPAGRSRGAQPRPVWRERARARWPSSATAADVAARPCSPPNALPCSTPSPPPTFCRK